jgi:hypothetical protein
MEQLGSRWTDFREKKSVEKFQSLLKIGQHHRVLYMQTEVLFCFQQEYDIF